MTRIACRRAMGAASQGRTALDEAERLRLEEHLQGCSACATDVSILNGIVHAQRSIGSLDASARERALARAFRARANATPPARAVASGWNTPVFAMAAIAACIALVLVGRTFVGHPTSQAAFDDASVDGAAALPAASNHRSFDTAAGERLTLEGASVTALRPSSFSWLPDRGTVDVSTGELRFEVEPGRSTPFVVVTPRYSVEVLGTVFDVEDGAVDVERGRVRVTWVDTADGTEHEVILGAGERWTYPVEATTAQVEEPSPKIGPAAQPVPVATLLSQARTHLAAGESKSARRLVERALAGKPSPVQHAEAQSLLAECALVAGDPKEAARRYAEVAKKHGDLPAGETALFAAGRAAQRAGQTADAKRLLSQYLAKYPNGQFAKDARARLAQLGL